MRDRLRRRNTTTTGDQIRALHGRARVGGRELCTTVDVDEDLGVRPDPGEEQEVVEVGLADVGDEIAQIERVATQAVGVKKAA